LPFASYYYESVKYWDQAKNIAVGSARSIKSCIRPAVRQVVFTDVQIKIRELQFSWCSDIGQSFAPIGLHKTNAASDWLLIK
jgi:hypothetical protein